MPEIREHEMEPQFEIFLFVPRIYHEVLKIWPLRKQIILFYFQFSMFLSTSSGERVRLPLYIRTYTYTYIYIYGVVCYSYQSDRTTGVCFHQSGRQGIDDVNRVMELK